MKLQLPLMKIIHHRESFNNANHTEKLRITFHTDETSSRTEFDELLTMNYDMNVNISQFVTEAREFVNTCNCCLLYTSPSPRDRG